MPKSSLQLKPPPGRIKRQGLVEEVYNLIRADIMSLRIPPDSRILVDNLVRDLGVSQTPIREALSMLEGVGLVSKKHFIGYCTAPTLNRKQFEELFEIRLLIEPAGASYAAQRMTDSELADLVQHAAAMEPGVTRASYDLFADQDAEFHSRLAAGSGNALIAEALGRLHTHMHIFRLRFHREIATEAASEHALLIQALQQRDADAAGAAMREHIEKSYNRLVQFTIG
jgi:DNA-binding GntR family transcriptional regulator